MNFCKICMNLLELKNKTYKCNKCDNVTDINNNSILFHKNLKNNINFKNMNDLKKYDIYRRKKDSQSNEFLLYSDINFNSKNILIKK